MRIQHQSQTSAGFNILDLIIVLVTVGLLIAVGLPWLARQKIRSSRISCVSNLRSIGLGFRMWANDHSEKFPMAVSTNQDGSMEYNETGQVFRHFQSLSNELNSPKVLICPEDSKRVRATNWLVGFTNLNISYFVGLDARETKPQSILSGDRNITGGILTNGNIMLLNSNSPAAWQQTIHRGKGNILMGDDSAQQVTEKGLRSQIAADTNAIVRFAIP